MYLGMISTIDYFPQSNITAHDSGVTSVTEQQAPFKQNYIFCHFNWSTGAGREEIPDNQDAIQVFLGFQMTKSTES